MKRTYAAYELSDFRRVNSIIAGEYLDTVKVAYTSHAVNRMEDTEKRDVEESEVESLLIKAYDELECLSVGEGFVVATEDMELAVCGYVYSYNYETVLILSTIIRIQLPNGNYKKLGFSSTDQTLIRIAA